MTTGQERGERHNLVYRFFFFLFFCLGLTSCFQKCMNTGKVLFLKPWSLRAFQLITHHTGQVLYSEEGACDFAYSQPHRLLGSGHPVETVVAIYLAITKEAKVLSEVE